MKIFQNIKRKIILKYLWIKHSYTFNWAHKPLCKHFSKGFIKLNKIYLCRSCTMTYFGITVSLLSLFSFISFFNKFGSLTFIMLCLAILPFSYPEVYKNLHRSICDLLRFFLGFIIPLSIYLILSKQYMTGIPGIIIILLFWKIYFHKRKIRKLKACDNCIEFDKGEICSGFKMQAQNIRNYENEATDFIINSGYIPSIKTGLTRMD